MPNEKIRFRLDLRLHRAGRFPVCLAAVVIFAAAFAQNARSQPESDPSERSNPPRSFDVVFVLDDSGSMRQHDPTYLTRTAVEAFARRFGDDAGIDGRIGIVRFDARAELVLPLTKLTPDRSSPEADEVVDALRDLRYAGQRTNTPAGVERALYELRNRGRLDAHKAIVLLTDGKIDTGDAARDRERGRWLREDLAAESRAEGIQIFGIAFTESADYELMQALALATGARYFRAPDASQLGPVVGELITQLEQATDYHMAASGTGALRDAAGFTPSAREQSALQEPVALQPVPASAPNPAQASSRSDSAGWLAFVLPGAVLLTVGVYLFRRRQRRAHGSFDFSAVDPSFHLPLFENMRTGPPTAQLRDLAGRVTDARSTLSLRPNRTTVGRDAHNDIVLDVDAISSEHALIERIDGRFWLEDRRSTNGTCLDGEKIPAGQRVELKGGDAIRFADIDFQFTLPGYTPGGDTVVLHQATALEAQPLEASQAPAAGCEFPDAESEPVEHSSAPRSRVGGAADSAIVDADPITAPARIVDLDARLASEFESPQAESIRECLDLHLSRVAEIAPAFEAFVSRAFDADLRDAICQSGADLIRAAKEQNQIAERAYTSDHIRYLLCAVPGEMDEASTYFETATGGFTGLLSSAVEDESFRRDRCETLAVLTFGESARSTSGSFTARTPWVSLSIVPANSAEPRIDLLSYEFLSAKERADLEPLADPEISHSGFA